MITEIKKWITKCDVCGKEEYSEGSFIMPPNGWKIIEYIQRTTSLRVDMVGRLAMLPDPEEIKHQCPDCQNIQDVIE